MDYDSLKSAIEGNDWYNKDATESADTNIIDGITQGYIGSGDKDDGGEGSNSLTDFIEGFSNNISSMGDISSLIANSVASSKLGTKTDNAGGALATYKSEKYKKINENSKNGLYLTQNSFFGAALKLYIGTLGKSDAANVFDSAISLGDWTGSGTGFSGLDNLMGQIEQTAGLKENYLTSEELIEYALANFYTFQNSKPGRHIRAVEDSTEVQPNFITNLTNVEISDSGTTANVTTVSDGNNSTISEILNWLSSATDTVSNVISTVSSVANLSSLTGLLSASSDSGLSNKDALSLAFINQNKNIDIDVLNNINAQQEIMLFDNPVDGEGKAKLNITRDSSRDNDRSYINSRWNNYHQNIGNLYIEPFTTTAINDGRETTEGPDSLKPIVLPFESNPEISEGGANANYAKTELLGRQLSLRSYINSDSADITLTTSYLALHPDWTDNTILDGTNDKSLWMKKWTPNYLQAIERVYRSLVYPYKGDGYFIRPPLVRIQMRSKSGFNKDSISYVGDLFKYPRITYSRTSEYDNYCLTNEKRYIVTSVQISPLTDGFDYIDESLIYKYNSGTSKKGETRTIYNNNGEITAISDSSSDSSSDGANLTGEANYGGYRRMGFKVTLTMSETTKYFLDEIPTYKEYVIGSKKYYEDSSDTAVSYNSDSTATDDNSEIINRAFATLINDNLPGMDGEIVKTEIGDLLDTDRDTNIIKYLIDKLSLTKEG